MNRQMWANAADAAQRRATRRRRRRDPRPGSGDQACGEIGDGRMLEPEEIFAAVDRVALQPKLLAGKRVLLTAGPDVRGDRPGARHHQFELGQDGLRARAGRRRGRRRRDAGQRTDGAADARGRRRASTSPAPPRWLPPSRRASRAADVFVAVAAVADYTPVAVAEQKIKKDGRAADDRRLKPTVDILATVAARADAPFCVGFAAESHDVERHAEEKRRRKKVPLIIANRAQDALGRDDNEVTLLDDAGAHPLPRMDKLALARRLVARDRARGCRRIVAHDELRAS